MTCDAICHYVDDALANGDGGEAVRWLMGVVDRRRVNRFVYSYVGMRFQRQWTTAERNALASLTTHEFLAITDHIANVDPTKISRGSVASERSRHACLELRASEVVSAHVTLTEEDGVHVGRCPFHYRSDCRIVVDPRYDTFRCTNCGFEGDAHEFLLTEMLWASGALPYR